VREIEDGLEGFERDAAELVDIRLDNDPEGEGGAGLLEKRERSKELDFGLLLVLKVLKAGLEGATRASIGISGITILEGGGELDLTSSSDGNGGATIFVGVVVEELDW